MSEHCFYGLDGPLEAGPKDRQMRTANFSGFAALIRRLGGDPRRILEHHGIQPQTIQDPDAYIDCQSLVDVLEYCSTGLKDSLFGLRLAQVQTPDVFGSVTTLCRAAPTVREAIGRFIEFIPVAHCPVPALELVEGKHIAELRWSVPANFGANNQAHLQATLLDLNFLRLIGGGSFQASYISLSVDVRNKDVPEIEARLGCRFHNRASTNAIAFPKVLLDQPVPSANRLVYRLLGGYLMRVKEVARKTLVERVEDYVRGSLPSGTCSIEQCASRLGTPVRTLQLHLSHAGLKFSDILEQQRIVLAKTYLEQEQLSLDEVAALLGYSEQSSFGRAFKRWTGCSPQRYRAVRELPNDLMH